MTIYDKATEEDNRNVYNESFAINQTLSGDICPQ